MVKNYLDTRRAASCVLTVFVVLALNSTLRSASADVLTWRSLSPLPERAAVAGAFAGVSNDVLILAGGSNFPNASLAEGGMTAKVWHDRIWTLADPGAKWQAADQTLPRPLAGGTSVTVDEGLICIGGADMDRHYADVFRLEWRDGQIHRHDLPSLPQPLANACGAVLDRVIYVAGGTHAPDDTTASKQVWTLDLDRPTLTWQEIESLPGPGRILPVAAIQADSFLLFSGAELSADKQGQPQRRYLVDSYRYRPGGGWSRLADMPRAALAAPSPAPTLGSAQVLIVGGVDLAKVSGGEPQAKFIDDVLAYNLATETWTVRGTTPVAAGVTPCVSWGGGFVIPCGEVQPGIRTPQVMLAAVDPTIGADGVLRNRLLPPTADNPRNSEGDFIQLKDGRVLFVYTHFTGGAGDHATAYLAGRFSSDHGKTWTKDDVEIIPNDGGLNVMSVSLLRLDDGSIALFYCRKNSLSDCRPQMRISTDEAQTWSEPRECISDHVAYYVMNNDRAVQLASGRLVLPVALHQGPDGAFTPRAQSTCYYSDDCGHTWQRSNTLLELTQAPDSKSGLQEPGVIELKDHSLLMYCRTDQGRQFYSRSQDGGETWSPVEASPLMSPTSPASMSRIPKTGDILVVWNDHRDFPPDRPDQKARTPLRVAISQDEGRTWLPPKTLESDPIGWYCYTAIDFVGDRVLLGHCAGKREQAGGRSFGGLSLIQITSFDVDWLYQP